MVIHSAGGVRGQSQSRTKTPLVFVSALFSGATAVPVWFLIALIGIFSGFFFFLPWSANVIHIFFMVGAAAVGVVFAVLHWRFFARNVAFFPHPDGDAEEPVVDGNDDHFDQRERRLLSHESRFCCLHTSRLSIMAHDVLLAVELLILGVLVLLSPYVVVSDGDGSSPVASQDNDPALEAYPLEIVWKMCLLHFWFIFAINVSFCLCFSVGMVHFAVLMVHYAKLKLVTISLSVVWFLTPAICIIVVAFRHRHTLRWERYRAPVAWPVSDEVPPPQGNDNSHHCHAIHDTPGKNYHISSSREMLLRRHVSKRASLCHHALNIPLTPGPYARHCFPFAPNSVIPSRQQRKYEGDDTQNGVLQHINATHGAVDDDLQAPCLFLSPNGSAIIGANVSFAARVGMSVKHLCDKKLDVVLRELEVENLNGVMEVVREVARSTVHTPNFLEGGVHSEKMSGTHDCGDGLFSPRECSLEKGVVRDVDGGECSTVQSRISPVPMNGRSVHRILLRGKCLRRLFLSPSPSSLTTQAKRPSTNGQEISLLDSKGDITGDSLFRENDMKQLVSFSFSLDVWMEPPCQMCNGNGFIVLCQPRQHCILDWIPLPCFLAHPVTGEVLYWSRAAERQTGKSAYDMVGWPVHVTPIPDSLVLQSPPQRGGRPEHSRWTRIDSSLHAFLHVPSSSPSSPLSVRLQPLTGKFAEDEGTVLNRSVVGLVWPPRHFDQFKLASLDNGRSAEGARETGVHCSSGKIDEGVTVHVTPQFSPFSPRSGETLTPGRDIIETRQRSSSVASWYFSLLTNGKGGDVALWANAGVPLLFVIQDEVNLSSSLAADNSVNQVHELQGKEDILHAVSNLVRMYRGFMADGPGEKMKWAESSSEVDEEVNSHSAVGKLRQINEAVSRVEQVMAAFQAPPCTEAVDMEFGESDVAGNGGSYTDPAAGGSYAVLAVSGTSFPVSPAAPSTPSNFLPPLVLLDSHDKDVAVKKGVGDGGHTLSIRTSGMSDGEGDKDEGKKRSKNVLHGGSNSRTVHTPLCDSGSCLSKNLSAPRLISPMLVEISAETASDAARVSFEMVSKGQRSSSDAISPNFYAEQQQKQQGVVTPLATPSMAESAVPSDFATTPVVNNNVSADELPIWAMLRSSDEATIPSCFIHTAAGEFFRFGRSSKCHATTSDTFVSSIQFSVSRSPYPQSTPVQSNVHRYPTAGSSHGDHQLTSFPSNPSYFNYTPGSWTVLLYDNSANGTYVNVKKVGKGKSCVLRDHDLVTFRLSSSRFFLGFQFLLTDEWGRPLREVTTAATVAPILSRVDSTGVSRRGTPHYVHQNSSENGSISAVNGNQMIAVAQINNNNFNGVITGSRCGGVTATKSRSSRHGGSTSGAAAGGVGGSGGGSSTAAHQRETIEWKIGEEMLGKGGNAEVYLGINLTNGKLIAVKRVPLPTVTTSSAENREVLQQYRSLREEINVLSKAVHTNIVQYYGSSQNQKYFNILLEFVPGGSLRHLLDNFGALSPVVICSYLRQTLEGLRYLHQHNIVHSDVKAANILITDKGRVKLSDFGTAKLLNRQHSQSLDRMGRSEAPNTADAATYRVAGTLRWMAPELFRSNSNSTTANTSLGPTKASDIWSVGCALIEMLSSEGPWYEYEFESEEQIINLLKYTTEPPEVPDCPELPELTAIARRCLALSPESRPTCEELLRLVEEASDRFQLEQNKSSSQPNVFPPSLPEMEVLSRAPSKVATDAPLGGADDVATRHQDPHGPLELKASN